MKLKKGVQIINDNGIVLSLGNITKKVLEKDEYLIQLIKENNKKDKSIIEIIMKKENINEVAASFGLGQFILDYREFIEEDKSRYIITN